MIAAAVAVALGAAILSVILALVVVGIVLALAKLLLNAIFWRRQRRVAAPRQQPSTTGTESEMIIIPPTKNLPPES